MIKKTKPINKSLLAFWHLSSKEIVANLCSHQDEGLTEKEARKRLELYGHNVLKSKKKIGTLKILLSQFNTPLMYLLIFAAGLSLLLYDTIDALIIFGLIFISTFLSFIQERGAVRAMEKLLKIVQIKANVIRGKVNKEISIEDVVPGDIVELRAGDVIPGDCYLLEVKDLYVDEATLTGETFYTEKHSEMVAHNASIAKRTNVLFMGTHVVSGIAKAIVVLTGKNTEFGQISERLISHIPETEFEHGIRCFGYFLVEVTFFLLIVILALNIYLARPVIESILFALSLSVGMTPQLLPAIIAINLAYGAKKMAKNHVIVKKLSSIENFGSMNILCADKTGTLTSGKIKLNGAFDYEGKRNNKVFLYAYLNAKFQSGYTNPIDNAITEMQNDITDWNKLDEVPYDFIRKRLSILFRNNNSCFLITKGAFQSIINICTHVETELGAIVDIHQLYNRLLSKLNF